MCDKKFYACRCDDVSAGGPWLRSSAGRTVSVNKASGWILTECEKCGGLIAVSLDSHNRITVKPLSADTILSQFGGWAETEAETNGINSYAFADMVEKSAGITKAGSENGCNTCRFLRPYNPDPAEVLCEVSREGFGFLYLCPACGSYRWLSSETHGFAEIPVWGYLTEDDLKTFSGFLKEESAKKNISEKEMIEYILSKTV